MQYNKIAFIVLSCDNYSDLWPIFISQFEKNWPDCPFDKYISTNNKDIPSSSFQSIKIGTDKSWSDGVIKALSILKKEYTHVLVTLEDSFLIEKVDNSSFNSILMEFEKADGNYLKFIRKPKPTKSFNQYFGIIEPGSLYRPTCVYALWKIDTFLQLLKVEENAWQFERFGSVRSDFLNGFYVVYKDFFKYINSIVKGKWVPVELKKVKVLEYSVDERRKTLSKKEEISLKINTLLFNLFNKSVNWKYRRKIIFKIKGYARKYNNSNL